MSDYDQIQRAYKQLVYAISHDFNAPLRSIGQFSELIISMVEENSLNIDDEIMHWLELINLDAKRAQAMAVALLRVYKLFDFAGPNQVFDLRSLAEESLTSISSIYTCHHYDLDADRAIHVYGNRDLWQELIRELLLNASIFQPIDTLHQPVVRLSIFDSPRGICIEDNGISVGQNMYDEITQPFRRCNPESRYPGMGIGLTVCRQIASMEKADLCFGDSELGGLKVEYFVDRR